MSDPIFRDPSPIAKVFYRVRYRPWFWRGHFTSDWIWKNYSIWRRVLKPLARAASAHSRDRLIRGALRAVLPEIPAALDDRLHRHLRRHAGRRPRLQVPGKAAAGTRGDVRSQCRALRI